MTAREMAKGGCVAFFEETGECPGRELANDSERNKLAYDMAWENFLQCNTYGIPEFCIVEDYVHEFLLYGV